jgi:hypothetical protein
MNQIKKINTIILFLISLSTFAQVESIFNGTVLGESLDVVTNKLNSIAETTNIVSVKKPSFPLAKIKEDHLVCTNIKTKNGLISKAIFTFADDKLGYIEAHGSAYQVFTANRKDTARTYMDYEVFFNDKLFLKKDTDVAWILAQEAIHTNLFTWTNPYLNPVEKITISSSNSSQVIPEFLKMGADLNQLKPLFEANSKFTFTEELDGSDPNAQLQVNCFGVYYLGFPRKAEARFGNNKLNTVWILTAKGEEDRVRKALTAQYGKPVFVTDEWEIFNNWQVGLRKDKPEVLLLTQKIGLEYKKSYFKQ